MKDMAKEFGVGCLVVGFMAVFIFGTPVSWRIPIVKAFFFMWGVIMAWMLGSWIILSYKIGYWSQTK